MRSMLPVFHTTDLVQTFFIHVVWSMSRDVKFLSQTSRVQNIFRKILKFDPAQNYSQCLLSLTNKHTRRLVQTTKDHTIAPKI